MKDHDFCNRLKSLRARASYTQDELGRKSDIPPAVISFYETGERAPGLAAIKALCAGLGCTATELLGV